MENLSGKHLFISEGIMITAILEGGIVVKTVGTTVKAEQIEMNVVKLVKRDGTEEFVELSENVHWLPEREGMN